MTASEARERTLDRLAEVLAGCGATDPESSPGVCAALITMAVTVMCGANRVPFDKDIITEAGTAAIEVINRRVRAKRLETSRG